MCRYVSSVICCVLLITGCSSQSAPESNVTNSSSTQEDPHAEIFSKMVPSGSAAMQAAAGTGPVVELGKITLTAPAEWKRVDPSSSFVVAEFSLPSSEEDAQDGRLTISAAGGSLEANIQRWKEQFDPLVEDKPTQTIEGAGRSITVVDLSGDFNDARGPFAPAVKRAGYRMIAAIIPEDVQSYFVKATGPEKLIAAYADSIHQFIQSIDEAE